MSWILNVCDSSPNINTKSSCKKECVLLLRVCKESVCRACLNFICKGGLFASVGPGLMCKESVYRACLNFICCQIYSAKLVSLIANSSWFILLLGNVRPELHTESLPSTLSDTYSLMYYSYVTYFKIINMIFKKIFSC